MTAFAADFRTAFTGRAAPTAEQTADFIAAAEKGDIAQLQKMHDLRFPLDQQDTTGVFALYAAVDAGQFAAAEFLLQKGASANVLTHALLTPLGLAVLEGREDFVTLLLKFKADPNQLIDTDLPVTRIAAAAGHCAILSALLDAGADPLAAKSDLNGIQAEAAMNGRVDILKLMQARGHSLDVFNKRHESPLMQAVMGFENEAAAFLIQQSNIDARDADGNTALILAATNGNAVALEGLLAAGAAVETKNLASCTALFYAAVAGNKKCATLLLGRGANTDGVKEAALAAGQLNIAVLVERAEQQRLRVSTEAAVSKMAAGIASPVKKLKTVSFKRPAAKPL